MKIFVSWSGEMSKQVAQVLKTWLPRLIQAVEVFFSPEDIEKGENWDSKITQELASCNYGIICLTSENKVAPWIHFEAGAIAKTLESRVSTLLVDIKPSDIKGPLSRFQATKAEKKDFSQLILDINKNIESPLDRERIEPLFEALWPKIHDELTAIKNVVATPEEEEVKNDLSEPIEEMLQLLRKQNSFLSDPGNLLPIDYYEYLQRSVNTGNSKKAEEIILELMRYLEHVLDRMENYQGDLNLLILNAIEFDDIFMIIEQYISKCSIRTRDRLGRRYMNIKEHYSYLINMEMSRKE